MVPDTGTRRCPWTKVRPTQRRTHWGTGAKQPRRPATGQTMGAVPTLPPKAWPLGKPRATVPVVHATSAIRPCLRCPSCWLTCLPVSAHRCPMPVPGFTALLPRWPSSHPSADPLTPKVRLHVPDASCEAVRVAAQCLAFLSGDRHAHPTLFDPVPFAEPAGWSGAVDASRSTGPRQPADGRHQPTATMDRCIPGPRAYRALGLHWHGAADFAGRRSPVGHVLARIAQCRGLVSARPRRHRGLGSPQHRPARRGSPAPVAGTCHVPRGSRPSPCPRCWRQSTGQSP